MQAKSDAQLLRDYAELGSEAAFEEIVSRHTSLVYSAALRQVNSPSVAAEVAQTVFIGLARGARPLSARLAEDASLAGWLCRSARNVSLNSRRDELRRHSRERLAMQDCDSDSDSAPDWERLSLVLDDAMSDLNESDYEAVVMRFFKNQDLLAVGQVLGVSDDAAQKRVTRALEKLREHLTRRGVSATALALATALAGNAVITAPAGLAATISTAALGATTLATAAIATTTAAKAIAMTTLQKTLVAATLVAAVGSGIYATHQDSRRRQEARSLAQTQAALNDELAQLKAENERLSASAAPRPSNSATNQQFAELLQLRGKAQLNAREIAELKAAIAQNSGKIPEPVAQIMNEMLASARDQSKQAQKSLALGKLKRMSQKIELSPEQQQQVSAILLTNSERRAQMELAHVTGTLFLENVPSGDKITQEETQALSSVLSSSQMTTYEQWTTEETEANRKAWIAYEKSTMKRGLKLTKEQTDQVSTVLSNLKPGEGGPGITYYPNAKEQLETRLRAFEPILTPQQLQDYRRMKMEGIEEKAQFAEIVMALKR